MIILLYSALYLFMMGITTTISKINEKIYNYAPLNITVFYMNIFYPILLLIYIKLYSYKSLLKIPLKDIKNILIPSIVYTLELAPLYWCLLYVPLGFYMIGRTSSAFFNVLFTKYYIHKTIHNNYYIGLGFLLLSYILFLIGLNNKPEQDNKISKTDYRYILSIIIVFITGFTTSLYNNMSEKYFEDKANTNKNKINYLIIYNLTGFILLTPIFLGLAITNNDFITDIGPNVIYIIAGLCIQLYVFVKLYILATKNISGNQLVTGIELLRRILTNIFAYIWLQEYYNINIIIANICMFFGSCFVIAGSFKSRKINDVLNINETILLINNNQDKLEDNLEENNETELIINNNQDELEDELEENNENELLINNNQDTKIIIIEDINEIS